MVNIGNYDPNAWEPRKALEPLPAGWYAMQITGTEVVRTKSGDGQFLKLEHEVLETHHPEHKGQKVWHNLNLWNRNPQAAEIANRELSAICRAVGVMEGSPNFDSDWLLNIPIAVKLRVRGATEQYRAQNEVEGYAPLVEKFTPTGQSMSAPAPAKPAKPPAQAAPPPPVGTAASRPPWKK